MDRATIANMDAAIASMPAEARERLHTAFDAVLVALSSAEVFDNVIEAHLVIGMLLAFSNARMGQLGALLDAPTGRAQ